MNSEQLTTIRELIQTSSTLSDQERAEWTSLLGIMNDKQLLELEKILKTPTTGFSMPDITEKELPAPAPKPVEHPKLERSVITNLPKTQQQEPHAVITTPSLSRHTPLVVPDHPVTPKSVVAEKPTELPIKEESVTVSTPIQVKGLSDLANLTASQYRVLRPEDFLDQLNRVVANSDFFQTKFALERSPLYQTYLFMGKTVLGGESDFAAVQAQMQQQGREYMTQVEFEGFADILSNLEGK